MEKKKNNSNDLVKNGEFADDENSENSKDLQGSNQKPKYHVNDLLLKVDELIENFDYPLALKFCEKAHNLDPDDTNVLEVMGNIYAELGDSDKAKQLYVKAIELQPNEGHVKYLYLGQLSEGNEAVSYYQKSISLMTPLIDCDNDGNDTNVTRKDISNAYCSLAELYMTDCCMEADAEKLCENACQKALELDENNPEALLAMCNFLLSKGDVESTKSIVSKMVEVWKSLTETNDENLMELFSYESRMTLIKILIEVELYDEVTGIGTQLIEENEDDIRIWYYLGLSNSLTVNGEEPRFYLEKALELYEKNGHDDEEILTHIKDLLTACLDADEDDVNIDGDSRGNHVNGMDVDE